MSDKEREGFEAHIEKTEDNKPRLWAQVFASLPCNPAMPAHLEGVYLMRENQKAWLAWQARAALDAPAPTVDQAITSLVSALAASKGWMRGYAEAVIRDAIDRKEPSSQELSDEQIQSIAYDCNALPEVVTDKTLLAFARAVIAAKAQGGSHG